MPSKDVTAPERLLSVGQLAARSGVAVTALHFYESKGLIHSTRNNGNQRRFERAMLRRVAVIKMAQRLGVPLAQVAEALDTLPKGHTPTAEDWQRFSARWREDLTQRIEELMMLRDQLDGCIGCGCMSLKECPLRNHRDRLADEGPGPHPLGQTLRQPRRNVAGSHWVSGR